MSTLQHIFQSLLGNRPKATKTVERMLIPIEKIAKQPTFGCHMCGQCILHDTGMTCPMGCPKQLRNGPCGGTGADGSCEVDRSKRCVWELGYSRSQRLPWSENIYQRNPPVDWRLKGTSSWLNLVLELDHHEMIKPRGASNGLAWKDKPWRCGSELEQRLRAGEFAVTTEIDPPDDAGIEEFLEMARALDPLVDAVNITDNTRATVHMSSMAAAALLIREGIEPVMQITCRDRNRLALQSDMLGAAGLGVKNVLCLTGDYPTLGDHKWAKPVFDVDSINLISFTRRLCDQKIFMNPEKSLKNAPRLLLGGASAPLTKPLEFRPQRLAKKIAAGADFIQTQLIFDIDGFRDFMQKVRNEGLHTQVAILPGVGVLPGPKTARMINEHVSGLDIPEWVIKRIEGVPKEKQRAEGVAIAIELVQQLREIEGVAGVHITAVFKKGKVEAIQAIGEGAGFLPRPPLALIDEHQFAEKLPQ